MRQDYWAIAAVGALIGLLGSPVGTPLFATAFGEADLSGLVSYFMSLLASGFPEGYAAGVLDMFTPSLLPYSLAFVVTCAVVFAIALRVSDIRGDRKVKRDSPTENEKIYRKEKEIAAHSYLWRKGEEPEVDGVVVGSCKSSLVVSPGAPGLIVVAPSGHGKSRGSLLPSAVLAAERRNNLVIADPSGELWAYLRAYLEYEGYDVLLINLEDGFSGSAIDLLSPVKRAVGENNLAFAEEAARNLGAVLCPTESGENAIFTSAAAGAIAGVAYAICTLPDIPDEARGMPAVVDTITAGTTEGADTLKRWLRSLPPEPSGRPHPSVSMSATFLGAEDKLLSSIVSTIHDALSCFSSLPMRHVTSASSSGFGVGSIPQSKKPVAVFLKTLGPGKPANKVGSLFIQQLWDETVRQGRRRGSVRPCTLLLDEFHSLPSGWSLSACAEQARKYSFKLVVYIQSTSGLNGYAKPGDDGKDALLSNSALVLYCAGSDKDAELFEILGGKKTVMVRNAGETRAAGHGSRSEGFSEREIPNWPRGENLRRDPRSDGVLLFQNLPGDPEHSGRFEVPIKDITETFVGEMLPTIGSREHEAAVICAEQDRLDEISRIASREVRTWVPDFKGEESEPDASSDEDLFGL